MPSHHYEVYEGRRRRPDYISSRTPVKRKATRRANRLARQRPKRTHSVFLVKDGRASLIHQVHYSPKLGRLIAEEL